MKSNLLFVDFLSAEAFTVGFKKEGTMFLQIDKAQAKTEMAAEEMTDFSHAEKSQFVEAAQDLLTALNRDVNQLAAKIDKFNDAFKSEVRPKLQGLRDQSANLGAQLDEARNATEFTWECVKSSFKKAYQSSKDGFNQVIQQINDKTVSRRTKKIL